jgi:hypothetical protein
MTRKVAWLGCCKVGQEEKERKNKRGNRIKEALTQKVMLCDVYLWAGLSWRLESELKGRGLGRA